MILRLAIILSFRTHARQFAENQKNDAQQAAKSSGIFASAGFVDLLQLTLALGLVFGLRLRGALTQSSLLTLNSLPLAFFSARSHYKAAQSKTYDRS
jgi:hypothetical protein